MPGPEHQPVQWHSPYVFTEKPVLVGDFVYGQPVRASYCQYVERMGLWSCRVSYGQPPQPGGRCEEIALFKAYVAAIEEMSKNIIHYIDTIVLKICKSTENDFLMILRKETETNIQKSVKQIEEKMWH